MPRRECRHTPATEVELKDFERDFGPIPTIFREYLTICGGAVGAHPDWIDGIQQLKRSHKKYKAEFGPTGWTMQDVFIVGWDGSGNPFGIEVSTGKVVTEDHQFGGIHQLAPSFEALLRKHLSYELKRTR